MVFIYKSFIRQLNFGKFLAARRLISTCVEMPGSMKFMDENMQLCESPLDYLYDQQDFLVVGCLGPQGVGKSTILSLLTSNYASVFLHVSPENKF